MINLCHQFLCTSIKCDKVSADDYDVDNLISDNVFIRQRGFRAESFIVPPVSITVHFPCKVDISKIVFDPVVGRQKSSGFEIFTATTTTKQSQTFMCTKKKDQNSESLTNTSDTELVFIPVGKLFLKDSGPVCFENPSYKPRQSLCELTSVEDNTIYRATLRHHRMISLSAVSVVTIRIVRTIERSAPALKRLEIWGQPAASCAKEVQQKLLDLYKSTLHTGTEIPRRSIHAVFQSEHIGTGVTVIPTSDIEPLRKQICTRDVELDIPEDFMDPITCEIMALPLTLPSGKTIDQSTLDRHINGESAWGRPPSDPFTGLAFDNIRKPVPNVSLKLRIDQFLLSHSDTLKSTPRTVGRAGDLHNSHLSRTLLDPCTPAIPTHRPSSSTLMPMHSGRETLNKQYHKNLTTTPVSDIWKMNIHGKHSVRTLTTINSKRKRPVDREKGDSECTSAEVEMSNCLGKKPRSHEKQLSQSLDAAVFAALGGLPSYQIPGRDSPVGEKSESSFRDFDQYIGFTCYPTLTPKCAQCSKDHHAEHGENLYRLLCGHNVCKTCLISLSKLQQSGPTASNCPTCDQQFLSKDVVKLNL